MSLMIRTGIPVTTWEAEGDTVVMTALRILTEASEEEPTDAEIRERWGV